MRILSFFVSFLFLFSFIIHYPLEKHLKITPRPLYERGKLVLLARFYRLGCSIHYGGAVSFVVRPVISKRYGASRSFEF